MSDISTKPQVERAAHAIAKLFQKTHPNSNHRWIVSLAGIPASGKTTLANLLCTRANEIISTDFDVENHGEAVAVIPMDGYHLPRSELDKLPNREEAYDRRGAYWTFDVHAFSNALDRISKDPGDVKMHGWGHEIKDPSYDAITVSASTKIVIVEGLYVLLEKEEWATLVSAKADMRIFLQCPPEVTLERGPQRNFEAGICPTFEASVARWKSNDMANGEFLLRHLNLDRVDFLLDQ